MKEEKVIAEIKKLFKSGNFTLVTHDRGEYHVYKKKYDSYEKLPAKANYVIHYGGNGDKGYVPAVVVWLVEALGGNTDSI